MSVRSATMNIPSTGNSGNRNRKWPRLAILATAAVLLSAISFIGVGGAIPQPQQAFGFLTDDFGDATVDQSISQSASQSNEANQNQEANDSDGSTVDQSQSVTQSQSISQSASQNGTATD
jgi:hypothetical protein